MVEVQISDIAVLLEAVAISASRKVYSTFETDKIGPAFANVQAFLQAHIEATQAATEGVVTEAAGLPIVEEPVTPVEVPVAIPAKGKKAKK